MRCVIGFVALFLLSLSPSEAEVRALLVGVSDYENSDQIPDLKGPANDVRLLQRVLGIRGVEDIRVLADGISEERPDRASILGALAGLAADAAPGDLVYIHMSGHGTRQVDANGDEPDGLDEVFLPIDAASSQSGSQVENAILDDEIGDAVAAIRAKGASVWLVLDSCHAGTGLRAGTPGIVSRYVDPAALGLQIPTTRAVETTPLEAQEDDLPGGIIAFYSARSAEVAREVNLAPEGAEPEFYGLFTSQLASRLESSPGLTYRQLFEAVMSDINTLPVAGGARTQTPLWEGNLVDEAVLGDVATLGVRRFAVNGDEILAGTLHGFVDGTLVALVADAAASADDIIGHAQMEYLGPASAYLRPVGAECTPEPGQFCETQGQIPAEARFAQILASPIDETVRIAPPVDLATGAALAPDDPAYLALQEAVAQLNDTGPERVEFHEVGFDLESVMAEGRLWLGPVARVGERPAGASWADSDPQSLVDILRRIARAETLARMLAAVEDDIPGYLSSPVSVSTALLRTRVDDLAPPERGIDPRRECQQAYRAVRGEVPEELNARDDLKQCDVLRFEALGTPGIALDINRVKIDAEYCVKVAYQYLEGDRASVPVGDAMQLCSNCPDGYSAGAERLFVVATPARANAVPLDLSGLENCGPAAVATRSAAATRALGVLTQAAERPDLRGELSGGGNPDDVWVTSYSWRVLPKSEVFLRAGRTTE